MKHGSVTFVHINFFFNYDYNMDALCGPDGELLEKLRNLEPRLIEHISNEPRLIQKPYATSILQEQWPFM